MLGTSIKNNTQKHLKPNKPNSFGKTSAFIQSNNKTNKTNLCIETKTTKTTNTSNTTNKTKYVSFIDKMIIDSIARKKTIEYQKKYKEMLFWQNKDKRLDELMISLTHTYHNKIMEGINQASFNGLREKYMNFNKDDFKADFPLLGNPKTIASKWLDEMCKEDSKYVPRDSFDPNARLHFKGLSYRILYNKQFTIYFTW